MKILIVIVLLRILSCDEEKNSYSTMGRNHYIFEFPGKIYGRTIIGFIETYDSIAIKTSFEISYSKDRIIHVNKITDSSQYKYSVNAEKNVYVHGPRITCYDTNNFKNNKIHKEAFYRLIADDFLSKTNKEKHDFLLELSSK
ncbi:MAG TPA: hypothetical protein PLH27_00835 [bacterium]|nr:hypothetical protein [bacterium]HMY34967.1 hypothetical protein [bacterium]HMZ03464.1 hypothetical protein [bacterium]HNB08009.1 hypothetical protein [bacterium]HNB55357.1 hypothetical protein [bacterium]